MPTEPTKPPEGRSVWVAALMTVIAMLIAKACVEGMKGKPSRDRGAYSGRR